MTNYIYVCLNCGCSSDYENKDGECKRCEKRNVE